MKAILTILLIQFLFIHPIYSTTIISVKCGNWTDQSTWDLGRTPLSEDTVLVNTYVHFDTDFVSLSPGFLHITECGELCGENNYTGNFLFNGPSYLKILTANYGDSETNAYVMALELIHLVAPAHSLDFNGGACVGCSHVCENCENRNVRTDCPASLTELPEDPYLFIFPNPATDVLTIMGIKIKSGIKLFDLTGRSVIESETSADTALSVDRLSSGTYLLLVENGKTRTFRRIVINHWIFN